MDKLIKKLTEIAEKIADERLYYRVVIDKYGMDIEARTSQYLHNRYELEEDINPAHHGWKPTMKEAIESIF